MTKSSIVHDNRYDYSKVEYINVDTKVIIICPNHGEFLQNPTAHRNGHGCRKCGNELVAERVRKTTEEFIYEARKIHGETYDYSKTEYNHWSEKLIIICPKHGEFLQMGSFHLQGHGCPACRQSKGEKMIRRYLEKCGVKYIQQYKLLCGASIRRYDFFLPDYNMIIEYDGMQHFKFSKHFHKTNNGFTEKKYIDAQKTAYVIKNGHRLARIDHRSINKISQIIKKLLANPKKLYLSNRYIYREHIENLCRLSPKIAQKLLDKLDISHN